MKHEVERVLEDVLTLEAALHESAAPHVIAQLRAPPAAAAGGGGYNPATACCRRMRLEAGNRKFYELTIVHVLTPSGHGSSALVDAYFYGTCWGALGRTPNSWPQGGASPTLFASYDAAKRHLERAASKKMRTGGYVVVSDEVDIAVPHHVARGLYAHGGRLLAP
jgi:hypothetical protein